MTSSARLLDRIRNMPDLHALLRTSFEFDTGRTQCGDGLQLASGTPLEPIAGDFTGGAYLLCPERDGSRAVVFANSEGAGGLIADDLAGALEIIIGLAWQDCLGFSAGGDLQVMQTSAQHLERSRARADPQIAHKRARAAAALSLRVLPTADLVVRLHTAASTTVPHYLVSTDDGDVYAPPFGQHTQPRHGGWR
ncbi:hypothetical protein [Streptomyces sp. MAI_2237]